MRLAIVFLAYLWNGIFEMQRKKDDRDFARIAQNLGISVYLVQKSYNSAMRKIRAYLMRNKDKRHALMDGLETLENFKTRKNERDISFKSED